MIDFFGNFIHKGAFQKNRLNRLNITAANLQYKSFFNDVNTLKIMNIWGCLNFSQNTN